MRRFGFPIPEELSASAPLKLLVVDDEDAVRSTVSRMLKLSWPDAEVETSAALPFTVIVAVVPLMFCPDKADVMAACMSLLVFP